MRNAEPAGLTTTKHETTFKEMLIGIRNSLSDLASSDDGDYGENQEDDEEDPAGGKHSENDEPGWVMSTISNMVQYRMEHLQPKQMKLDELTQPSWGDTADSLCGRDKKYGSTQFKVLAVVQPQMAADTELSGLMTFGEPMMTIINIPGKSHMPLEISRPGSSHLRLGSRKLETHKRIQSLPPAPMPDSSPIQNSEHVEPDIFNPRISHPKLINIWKLDSD